MGGEVVIKSFDVSDSQLGARRHQPLHKKLPCLLQLEEHRAWTSTWFVVTAWTPDIHKASSSSIDYRHQHDLQWQYRPRTLTQPPAETQTVNIITALGGSKSHGHQHGLWHQHRSWIPTCPQWEHGSWTSTWFQETAQTVDINMAFGGKRDHQHGL